jgi:hypothetical protein
VLAWPVAFLVAAKPCVKIPRISKLDCLASIRKHGMICACLSTKLAMQLVGTEAWTHSVGNAVLTLHIAYSGSYLHQNECTSFIEYEM